MLSDVQFPVHVSLLYPHVQNYVAYLNTNNVKVTGRLMSKNIDVLGFSTMPSFCQTFNMLAICFYYLHDKEI